MPTYKKLKKAQIIKMKENSNYLLRHIKVLLKINKLVNLLKTKGVNGKKLLRSDQKLIN